MHPLQTSSGLNHTLEQAFYGHTNAQQDNSAGTCHYPQPVEDNDIARVEELMHARLQTLEGQLQNSKQRIEDLTQQCTMLLTEQGQREEIADRMANTILRAQEYLADGL